MRSGQITLRDLLAIYRRRKKFLFLPALIITVLSVLGAIVMKDKFESSTTILVQRDEILNPLISYQMAIAMATEDRLRTFNEIIYSNTTMKKLNDSLFRIAEGEEEQDELAKLEGLRKKIKTERRGSDSFRISFTSSDRNKAQAAVALLADEFISTILHVEGQRNEQAVAFFQEKLDELKAKFEGSQQKVVSALRSRADLLPQDSRNTYVQVDLVEKDIAAFDRQMDVYKEKLEVLKHYPAALQTPNGKEALYELTRAAIPFAVDLKMELEKYDDLSRRYRGQYPELQRMESALTDLLQRIQKAIENEMQKQEPVRTELENKRTRLIEQLNQASISQMADEDVGADYSVYKKLYDEMKVKLEQAITSRDLGRTASNQFIIIDPPLVPQQPTQPNRPLVVLGGLFVGLFVGILAAIFKELLDTTIRSSKDIEVYHKPVVAFITRGEQEIWN